jgi:ATP-dependent Clp protease adaptor protein ClpS
MGQTQDLTRSQEKVTRPPLYHVILLNDDYTPMDFVVEVLVRFFRKSLPEANRVMMAVHQKGSGLCGVYSQEIAETKVHQVVSYSRSSGHPLMCVMEPEE